MTLKKHEINKIKIPKIMRNTSQKETDKYTIYNVVKRLRLKYRKWRVMNEIRQLNFDMQCTNMIYKQYKVDYDRLIKQYNKLQ